MKYPKHDSIFWFPLSKYFILYRFICYLSSLHSVIRMYSVIKILISCITYQLHKNTYLWTKEASEEAIWWSLHRNIFLVLFLLVLLSYTKFAGCWYAWQQVFVLSSWEANFNNKYAPLLYSSLVFLLTLKV